MLVVLPAAAIRPAQWSFEYGNSPGYCIACSYGCYVFRVATPFLFQEKNPAEKRIAARARFSEEPPIITALQGTV